MRFALYIVPIVQYFVPKFDYFIWYIETHIWNAHAIQDSVFEIPERGPTPTQRDKSSRVKAENSRLPIHVFYRRWIEETRRVV